VRGAVAIVTVDRLAAVAARGDVENGARELDAKGAGHEARVGGEEEKSKT
jgi:hypothetical protein